MACQYAAAFKKGESVAAFRTRWNKHHRKAAAEQTITFHVRGQCPADSIELRQFGVGCMVTDSTDFEIVLILGIDGEPAVNLKHDANSLRPMPAGPYQSIDLVAGSLHIFCRNRHLNNDRNTGKLRR